MKSKQIGEEFITRGELENTYNYQKKVFDSKIDELNKTVDRIQECFSLRFGEDIDSSKYDAQIEEIKNNIRQVQSKNSSEIKEIEKRLVNSIDGKLSEIEVKNQKNIEENSDKTKENLKNEIDELFSETNKKIIQKENDFNEFKNVKIKEVEVLIEKIEDNVAQIESKTDEYVNNFREQIEEIGRDGRSRTVIAKQERKLKKIKEKQENIEGLINNKIDEVNQYIKDAELNLNAKIDRKIDRIDFDEIIALVQNKIETKVSKEEFDEEFSNLNSELNGEFEKLSEEKLGKKEYENSVEQIKNDISEIKVENEKCIENIDTLEKDYAKNMQKLEEKLEDNFSNIYGEIELSQTVSNENIDCTREELNEKIESVQISLFDEISKGSKESLDTINSKVEKLSKEFKSVLSEKVNEEEHNELLNRVNKNQEFQQDLLGKIENQEGKNIELLNKLTNIENSIKDLKQECKDIESNMNKEIDSIRTKYDKLFENKLKKFEEQMKSSEKLFEKRIKNLEKTQLKEIEKRNKKESAGEVKSTKRGRPKKVIDIPENNVNKNYNVVTITGLDDFDDEDEVQNIYNEYETDTLMEAADTIQSFDNKQESLQNMINKLKFNNKFPSDN